jgi:hypothetical protein
MTDLSRITQWPTMPARSIFLPIHFKTFSFGREGVFEPMERLENAIEPELIGWRPVGQTFRA